MKRIAVLDTETDPFKVNRIPRPFLYGYSDGDKTITHWGDDCTDRMMESLESEPPAIIYVHNGGKFDFFQFLDKARGDVRIINGRIISMRVGPHEFRDSYAIMPFPLRAYQKDEIDYEKMERAVREQHRQEILDYLSGDLKYLYELCVTFHQEFGDKLTIGSAALTQLRKYHKFKCGGSIYDEKFRKDFYHGGRVQCFESGIIRARVKVIDTNSMYPYVMKSMLHPVSICHAVSNRIEKDTCFVVVEGHNHGAFPIHTKDNGLDFSVPYGTFSTTIHEFNAAIDTGSFRPVRIKKTYGFSDRITFEEFVGYFYNQRKNFKKAGDRIRELLYKYVLNSAYGKFAQNPENFFDWQLTRKGDPLLTEGCQHCNGKGVCGADCLTCKMWRDEITDECFYCHRSGFRWHLAETAANNDYYLWQSRTLHHSWYNVATGASITGGARAVLLRGLRASNRALYCDTDSIIGGDSRIRTDDSELGAWKVEAVGDVTAIAGKKMYAIFSHTKPPKKSEKDSDPEMVSFGGKNLYLVKKANKGARLTGAEILDVAQGHEVRYTSPVPAFKLSGLHQFVSRRINRTV